jgi:hypothetical protein
LADFVKYFREKAVFRPVDIFLMEGEKAKIPTPDKQKEGEE